MENEPHAQRATAFHFLISKRLGFLEEEEAAEEEDGTAALDPSPTGTIVTSVSMAVILPSGSVQASRDFGCKIERE